MKACTGKGYASLPYGWVCPLAVAVCEVHRPHNCLQKRGTPWRIGKQYEPRGDGRVGVFGQDIGKTAGFGLLLPEDELENREEDFEPTDHNRRGTGDHQA